MSFAQVLSELRQIKERLDPEPKAAFIDRDVLSKAAAVATFSKRVDGGLEIDGKDFSQYIIQSDGSIGDVSYRVKNLKGEWTTEFEASRLPYVPGPVELIQFKNDVAEAGKSIFVTKMKVPNLSAAPPPLPAEEVDPHLVLGTNPFVELAIGLTKKTGAKEVIFGCTIQTAANTIQTMEIFDGSDYSVPAGKETMIYKEFTVNRDVVVTWQIGYGDDGVAEGTADPTNPVFPPFMPDGGTASGIGQSTTVSVVEEFNFPLRIPAGKFPFIQNTDVDKTFSIVCLGVEYNA